MAFTDVTNDHGSTPQPTACRSPSCSLMTTTGRNFVMTNGGHMYRHQYYRDVGTREYSLNEVMQISLLGLLMIPSPCRILQLSHQGTRQASKKESSARPLAAFLRNRRGIGRESIRTIRTSHHGKGLYASHLTTVMVKAHSDELRFPYAAAANGCIAAKNRKSSKFLHRTCLPQLHMENAACVNQP